MKYFKWLAVLIWMLMSCSDEPGNTIPPPPTETITVRAADLSILPLIRTFNTPFKNADGLVQDALDIFQAAGCNTVRLRLWHTPATAQSSLAEVQEFAAEIKAKGLDLWLVIHYSDTWADPGTQTKPDLWKDLSLADLKDSVYNYTKKVVKLLEPEFVQIGNEINSGFLWPEGNIANVANFTGLLKEGVQGALEAKPNTKIMIHFAGIDGADPFFNTMLKEDVPHHIIALSYYPRWHTKSLSQLRSTLLQLSARYIKDLVIAETAYPFTLGWNDWTDNLVGLEEHLIPAYPATEKGQHDFLTALRSTLSETPGAIGFSYWAPEWVAYKGEEATDGSPWENMALFDFDFQALDGMKVFAENP
jgi:arabinogalactan endo-1,4-beta-galactosidase